jgi:flagellar motility protein MotE (MotC chaperone)
MKKLFDVFVLLLAVNFLAVAGFAVWLVKSHRVDRTKAMAIKEMVFPSTAPATQPVADATTQPTAALDELVARQSGRTAAEQVEFIQRTFDAQRAQLDRREREVKDLERQVELAKQKMARDRVAFDTEKLALKKREDEATKLANDKGFQDALDRYVSMPPKQVKQIFMTLEEKTAVSFLQAMEPSRAAKILKDFKTPDEVDRAQKFLERMRQAADNAKPAAQASAKE